METKMLCEQLAHCHYMKWNIWESNLWGVCSLITAYQHILGCLVPYDGADIIEAI